mgnify:CR=1 FL=1
MKLETVKTIALVVLISISFFLTFALWTYQPNNEYFLDDEKLLEEADLGGIEETKQTLIVPNKMVFHMNNSYYGMDPQRIKNLYENMQKWVYEDFHIEKVDETESHHYNIEVKFPTPLPMDVLNNIFHLNNLDIDLPSWSFQTFYVYLDMENASINVEFISLDRREKATAIVRDTEQFNSLVSLLNHEGEFYRVTAFDGSGSNIYIPSEQISLEWRMTTITLIEPEKLINVLFNDPSIVNQTTSYNGSLTFLTDSSQLRVLQDNGLMEFVSPVSESGSIAPIDLLNRSIVNINGHDGWTDDFNLMGINSEEDKVRYQMFYQGYPVFSTAGLSTIEQRWNSQRLVEYRRPLIRISSVLNESKEELPLGEEIIDYLYNQDIFKLENINDITIGYSLDYNSEERYLVFDPGWFIKYNNEWIEINLENNSSDVEGGN